MVRLLIVTGAGRSGTSTVAGVLQRLGGVIPQPEVPTDERNPRGYYEPAWCAAFHKQWLDRVPVRTIDTRPDAVEIAMATADDDRRAQLLGWLREQVAEVGGPGADVTLLIKETRAYLVYPLWLDVAAEAGLEPVVLSMLRHPAQVVRSRDSAYLSHLADDTRRERETANVAAWANSVVITERVTRGRPRAFVRYDDLLADWRTAVSRACGQLSVPIPSLDAPHPVDEFVTPTLNRSGDSWDGLRVEDWVREHGQSVWTAAAGLVERPDDAAITAELSRLSEEYAPRYRTAVALATDEIASRVRAKTARLEGRIEAQGERLERKNAKLRELREQLRRLRGSTGESA